MSARLHIGREDKRYLIMDRCALYFRSLLYRAHYIRILSIINYANKSFIIYASHCSLQESLSMSFRVTLLSNFTRLMKTNLLRNRIAVLFGVEIMFGVLGHDCYLTWCNKVVIYLTLSTYHYYIT